MSNKDVNLVPQEVRLEKKKTSRKGTFSLGSLLLFIISASMTLSLVLINFSQTKLIASTQTKIEKEVKVVNSQLPVLQMVKKVEDKAAALGVLLESKVRFSRLLKILPSLLPQGTRLTQFSVSGLQVQMAGSTYGVLDIAKFLRVVVDENKGGVVFSEVHLKSINLDARSGRSDFTMDLTIKEGVLNRP